MLAAHGGDPLDDPLRVGKDHVLVRNDHQDGAGGVEQLPGPQQEVRITGPPEPLIASSEGLVDQYSSRPDGADNRRQQRPPEVIRHDDAVEALIPEGPWRAILEVRFDQHQPAIIRDQPGRRYVAVEPDHPMARFQSELQVPPTSAGDIENLAVWPDQVQEARHPWGRSAKPCALRIHLRITHPCLC